MSRDDSIAETAKQRSLRVALDHYRHPNPLARIKLWLSFIAGAAALAYFAWLMLPGSASHQHASPGPLAAAHATWNNNCTACHRDFQPLRPDAVSVVGLFRGESNHREAIDQSCIKCHSAPVHHASAKPGDVPSCAACHRDHQGRMADIVRPADSNCLGCHRETDLHRNGPSKLTPAVANISGFGPVPSSGQGPHPDFRSLQHDPGNIKFNHWLHLQPGIAVADARKKLRLSDLEESFQRQYAGFEKADGLVQLDCAACHEPDRSGAYIRPIAYEQHCQACHPLALKTAENQSAAQVPHGLTSERLTTVLDGLLFAGERKHADQAPTTSDESGTLPLVPGRTLGSNLAQKISADLLGQRTAAGRAVMIKCLECHYPKEPSIDASAPSSARWGGMLEVPTEVLPADIPTVWLRHARFDHRAHRHVDCRSCHAAAFAFEQRDKPQFLRPPVAEQSSFAAARDSEQVMIAGLESCANCHAPSRGSAGGARFDCAECHNYHGGDTHVGRASSLPSSSFPGSSLGTHYHEAPASSASPSSPTIRLASFQTAATNIPLFTGTSSCASTGCHGDTRSNSPKWQTAFTTWASRDPHAQAYEVLWTHRGREMTRLLNGQSEQLTNSEHLQAVEHRCIGCHATPSPPNSLAKTAEYALGVQCESCHGAAGNWLHDHYQTNFRRDANGFIDTKDLNQRAATCMKCHVGPSDAAGSPQAVDHDLIAAGHPRLTFEFRSYFESLPAHWDRQKDESRINDGLHFQTWQAGQNETAAWRKTNSVDPLTDFAQLDCSACHHSLAADSWRLQTGLLTLPPPAPTVPIPIDRQFAPSRRLTLARELLTASESQRHWDGALQSYLAARAITADQPISKMADWNSLLANLETYLARDCFPAELRDKRRPSPYDSPSEFDPNEWRRQVEPVLRAIQQAETSANAP